MTNFESFDSYKSLRDIAVYIEDMKSQIKAQKILISVLENELKDKESANS